MTTSRTASLLPATARRKTAEHGRHPGARSRGCSRPRRASRQVATPAVRRPTEDASWCDPGCLAAPAALGRSPRAAGAARQPGSHQEASSVGRRTAGVATWRLARRGRLHPRDLAPGCRPCSAVLRRAVAGSRLAVREVVMHLGQLGERIEHLATAGLLRLPDDDLHRSRLTERLGGSLLDLTSNDYLGLAGG